MDYSDFWRILEVEKNLNTNVLFVAISVHVEVVRAVDNKQNPISKAEWFQFDVFILALASVYVRLHHSGILSCCDVDGWVVELCSVCISGGSLWNGTNE